jgi:membrane-bound serine protease (ClpP class)
MRKFLVIIFSFVIGILLSNSNDMQAQTSNVYVFKIHEEIAPPALKTTEDALKKADSLNVDLVILHLDTYGGMVDIADQIRTLILNFRIPVWVFIENNAASAGAFISLACDSIYMKPGSTIGASTVVDQQGEKVGEKYQSFMRSRMRSTAEQNKRNPDIAEGMVEAQQQIPGVVDSGKVVSLTVKEALELDFCDGEYNSIEEMLAGEGFTDYNIIEHEHTFISSIVRFFMRPAVSGILIAVIVLGIFFELKSPGIGIPTFAAILAAIFYFVPLYLEGLAAYWEIALFIVGIILLFIELLFIPGFGIPGILGATFIFFSLVLALVKAVPDSGPIDLPNTENLLGAVLTVILSMFSSFVIILLMGKSVFSSSYFKKVEVSNSERKEDGYTATPLLSKELIGQSGIAYTTLRPMGNIEISGRMYEAKSELGWIEKNETVEIIGIENSVLIVKKKS